jgi:hypothetical protein
MPLVLVLLNKERTAIPDSELRDYRNHPKHLTVPPDVMGVCVLE